MGIVGGRITVLINSGDGLLWSQHPDKLVSEYDKFTGGDIESFDVRELDKLCG